MPGGASVDKRGELGEQLVDGEVDLAVVGAQPAQRASGSSTREHEPDGDVEDGVEQRLAGFEPVCRSPARRTDSG